MDDSEINHPRLPSDSEAQGEKISNHQTQRDLVLGIPLRPDREDAIALYFFFEHEVVKVSRW